MANRPVFMSNNNQFFQHHMEFKWHFGSNLDKRQQTVEELHEVFKEHYPEMQVLEVSNISPQQLGAAVSSPELKCKDGSVLDSIILGSQVMEQGGPFPDIYQKDYGEGLKDKRIKESGERIGYSFRGTTFDNESENIFFNWLAITLLMENKDLAEQVGRYRGFTDLNYNPKKPTSTVAEALSIYKTLLDINYLETAMASGDSFKKIVYGK